MGGEGRLRKGDGHVISAPSSSLFAMRYFLGRPLQVVSQRFMH
jgi:hypothetical protein